MTPRHVFVISDLHLGGAPDAPDAVGSQICNAYDHLADFITWIASPAAAPRGEVELVINGDMVDFFALDGADAATWTADPVEAIARLDRVATRAAVVFAALRHFVGRGHRLTLLVGNHDVELSLPSVRAHLEGLVGGGDRVRLLYDGEAYTVGRALFEHGNRYDRWNVIDHSRLRQERSVRSRGLPVDESRRGERFFLAPAGSHLVVRVMNRVKARYRFVDLLKPETGAVIPLLLALEPDHRVELDDVLSAGHVVWNLRDGGRAGLESALPERPGNMGAEADLGSLEGVLREALGEDYDVFADEGAVDLRAGNMGGGLESLTAVKDGIVRRAGALADTAKSLWRVADFADERDPDLRRRKLLVALRHLNATDNSFDPARELPDYLDAARDIARHGRFELVVFGHTHLPKRVDLDGGALYLNSGTWVDVMRLPAAITGDDPDAAREALGTFIEAVRANDFAPYVKRYLSYVEAVVADDGRVVEAAVRSWGGKGTPRAPALTDVRSAS